MSAHNPLTAHPAGDWNADRASPRHRAMRRTFDRAALACAALDVRRSLGLLDGVARAANVAGLHGPAPSEVRTLFGPRTAPSIARSIAALHFKNRAAIALVQAGRTVALASLVARAPSSGAAALVDANGPRLVVAAHIGAFFGIRAALHATSRPVLMVRDQPLASDVERARVLKQAIDHVRAGGLVVTTLDGPGGTSSHEVECLGRRIVLRRGPLAIARMTGAPIVPAVCTWTRDHRIEVALQPPVTLRASGDASAAEREAAFTLAAWLDGYLRARPQQLWLSTLRYVLAAPASAASISRTRS